MLPHLISILQTKSLCLSLRYLQLFAYTHAKFERVEALLKGQDTRIGIAKKSYGAVFKKLSLYLRLPVIVPLFHGITVVTEGGDQVSLDSQTLKT